MTEPEPEPIDLSVLDVDVARGVARVLSARRLRGLVTRRGIAAAVLVAAALLVWLGVPRKPAPRADALSWAMPGATADQILGLGGDHAQ